MAIKEVVVNPPLKTQTVYVTTNLDGFITFTFDQLSEAVGIIGGDFPDSTEDSTMLMITVNRQMTITGNTVTIYAQIYSTGYTRTVGLTAIGY